MQLWALWQLTPGGRELLLREKTGRSMFSPCRNTSSALEAEDSLELPLPKETSVLFPPPGYNQPLCLDGLDLPAYSSQAPLDLLRSWKILETAAMRVTPLLVTDKQGAPPYPHKEAGKRPASHSQNAPGTATKTAACHGGNIAREAFCWDSIQHGS